MFNIEDKNDIQLISIKQREFFNAVDLLKKYQGNSLYQESVDYIAKEMDEYWSFISENIQKIDYLKESQNVLQRRIVNIKSKLNHIEWYLYE